MSAPAATRPWMPFYVRDYLGDTSHLSTVEHGAYLLLIMHYWLNGGLPADDTKLARIARLPPAEWSAVRDTVAEFFDEGWQHKRVDAELATTAEKYARRSKAGREGGIASGRARQRGTNAEAMLPEKRSNAEAMLNQPQPQPQPQPHNTNTQQTGAAAPSGPPLPEDRFWSRLDDLGRKGIGRSRCTQLVKLNGGDFIEANRVLDAAEAAKKPAATISAASSGGWNRHRRLHRREPTQTCPPG